MADQFYCLVHGYHPESQEGLKLFSRAYLVGSCLLESHGLHIHLDQLTVRRVAKDNAVGGVGAAAPVVFCLGV